MCGGRLAPVISTTEYLSDSEAFCSVHFRIAIIYSIFQLNAHVQLNIRIVY